MPLYTCKLPFMQPQNAENHIPNGYLVIDVNRRKCNNTELYKTRYRKRTRVVITPCRHYTAPESTIYKLQSTYYNGGNSLDPIASPSHKALLW